MREIPSWYREGLCKNYPTKMWYQYDAAKDRAAKRICGQCPVQSECLQFALEHDETGVWGGLNDLDRKRLIRKIYVQEALQASSRHNTRHELRHPASVSLSFPVRISFPLTHSRQVLSTAAVLQSPVFPMFCKG